MPPVVRHSFVNWSQNHRMVILIVLYAAVIAASFYLAYEIRFDFLVAEQHQQERLRLLPIVIGIKLLALVAARQFGSLMTYFSIPDLVRLLSAMLASSVLLLVSRIFLWEGLTAPRGVLLTDFMLCFGALCLGRIGTRIYRERLRGAKHASAGAPEQRIAIIGAGDVGAALAKEFINAPSRGFRPVVFFDDDPAKHGKLLHGVPVVGLSEAIDEARHIAAFSKVIIAMPSAPTKRVREIVMLFAQRGLKVETLPSLEELASGRVKTTRIRPVEVEDLLGREAVNLDMAGIRARIEGRCILVTGAGGSIGSELCRQIGALHPQRLLLVEQSEAALFLVEQELNELGFGGVMVALVGDILDRERMEFIFARYRPEVVFHAAAHKHVFMMERQPQEAFRNNVVGTRVVSELAAKHGASHFILISTDKAINPTSVMGATKRLAELQLMAIAAKQQRRREQGEGSREQGGGSRGGISEAGKDDNGESWKVGDPSLVSSGPSHSSLLLAPASGVGASVPSAPSAPTKFMAVRFGNVLGSSGSVVPIFKRQIANGGPVTVTHPEVTRYFMTIPEAVTLVLQSAVIGKGGEIFVLNMGSPIKIVDLARQMIVLSGLRVGDDIEIRFTGLKAGEKLFEELQHVDEEHTATEHPHIIRFIARSGLDGSFNRELGELEKQIYAMENNAIKEQLQRLIPEYKPHFD